MVSDFMQKEYESGKKRQVFLDNGFTKEDFNVVKNRRKIDNDSGNVVGQKEMAHYLVHCYNQHLQVFFGHLSIAKCSKQISEEDYNSLHNSVSGVNQIVKNLIPSYSVYGGVERRADPFRDNAESKKFYLDKFSGAKKVINDVSGSIEPFLENISSNLKDVSKAYRDVFCDEINKMWDLNESGLESALQANDAFPVKLDIPKKYLYNSYFD